jgi:regulatory protein
MYAYALKLLAGRDYTLEALRQKLEKKFGSAPNELLQQLVRRNYLNDRRFTENYVVRRQDRGRASLKEELMSRGVPDAIIEDVLAKTPWPSLHEAVAAKMKIWKLRAPLQARDAARLFRALLRLGYDEDAIREAIERLHDE